MKPTLSTDLRELALFFLDKYNLRHVVIDRDAGPVHDNSAKLSRYESSDSGMLEDICNETIAGSEESTSHWDIHQDSVYVIPDFSTKCVLPDLNNQSSEARLTAAFRNVRSWGGVLLIAGNSALLRLRSYIIVALVKEHLPGYRVRFSRNTLCAEPPLPTPIPEKWRPLLHTFEFSDSHEIPDNFRFVEGEHFDGISARLADYLPAECVSALAVAPNQDWNRQLVSVLNAVSVAIQLDVPRIYLPNIEWLPTGISKSSGVSLMNHIELLRSDEEVIIAGDFASISRWTNFDIQRASSARAVESLLAGVENPSQDLELLIHLGGPIGADERDYDHRFRQSLDFYKSVRIEKAWKRITVVSRGANIVFLGWLQELFCDLEFHAIRVLDFGYETSLLRGAKHIATCPELYPHYQEILRFGSRITHLYADIDARESLLGEKLIIL